MRKYAARGTALQRGDGDDPEVFATIAHVRNIGGPSLTRDTIDTTAHDTEDGVREFLASLGDGGEVTIDFLFDPTEPTHEVLASDWQGSALHNYRIVWPDIDNTIWGFSGLLTALSPSAPHDDVLGASATFKVSGIPDFSAGS